MNMNKKSLKAQITIFVIVAILIVAILLVIYLAITQNSNEVDIIAKPQYYVETCLLDSLIENEKKVLDNNGYQNITNNYILYKNEKVPYLCKASEFYYPCINQEPMFLEVVRNSLKHNLEQDAKICFIKLIREFEKKGYVVSESDLKISIEFTQDRLIATADKEINLDKADTKQTFKTFKAELSSPIYRLILNEMLIVNYESTLCEFNNVKWNMYNRDLLVEKFIASDGTKVYTIIHKDSGKDINMAIKTCVLPAGI